MRTSPAGYVVFLQRRNLLEAVVSNLIAEQTGLWAAWDRERALEEYYTGLAPLPVEVVRDKLRWTRENLAEMAAGRVSVVTPWFAAVRGAPCRPLPGECRLPNLAEIEAILGDDETGHLGYLALP